MIGCAQSGGYQRSQFMRWVLHSVIAGLVFISLGVRAEDAAVTKRFRELLAGEWEITLLESPTFASHLGDKRYNDRWPDASLAAIARRQEHRKDVLARLDAIDPAQLSAADWLNYQLYRKEVAESALAHPFRWYLVPLDQRGGIQTENELADSLQFNTVKDYEDWIARLVKFPVLVDQTIELMRGGIKERMVQPKVVMRRVPGQIKKQIVDDPAESLYYKPFNTFAAEIPASEQERLKKEAAKAIGEQLVPAYRKFARFFDEEYLPACFDEVGAWQLPRGAEFYAQRARHFTTTGMTPEEIHAIGQQEVARIRQKMEAIVKQVGFQGTFQEFLTHLRTDKRFYYDTPEELLTGYLALCKRVDPELTKLFKNLPRIPYGIEPIPQAIAPDTTTAYYRQPSADGVRPGTYFVNLYRPETRPKYEMEALSLHESVPGHHLQLALQAELGELPPFRRYGGFTAFVEGWGLYSESLGDELGCYKDPYSRFGQLTYEMWRAVRLVVDTGMHAKKWTRQQAIDFFKEYTAKTELDIVNEVDRYIAWPGQALAYKIGELKIKELRQRAKAKLGDKFDVREFHDVVLRQGAVPLDVLEGIVDEWLAAAK
jgi:prolyl oligopeptidase